MAVSVLQKLGIFPAPRPRCKHWPGAKVMLGQDQGNLIHSQPTPCLLEEETWAIGISFYKPVSCFPMSLINMPEQQSNVVCVPLSTENCAVYYMVFCMIGKKYCASQVCVCILEITPDSKSINRLF